MRALSLIAACFAGSIVGGLLVLTVTPRAAMPSPAVVATAAQPPRERFVRARAIETVVAAPGASPAPPAIAPDSTASREEARLEERRALASLLATQASEPIDRSWVPTAVESMRADLERLETEEAPEIRELECRSRSCTAKLIWSSPEAALASMDAVAQANLRVSCERTVFVPEGEATATQVVFHGCTRQAP